MVKIQECILYRGFDDGEVLEYMTGLINEIEHLPVYGEDLFYQCVNRLVEMAGAYGFSGNLWHNYLTYLLVNHENAFSTACEIRGAVKGSINALAMHDFAIFKELYEFDLKELD
jgi:hypothetical protein